MRFTLSPTIDFSGVNSGFFHSGKSNFLHFCSSLFWILLSKFWTSLYWRKNHIYFSSILYCRMELKMCINVIGANDSYQNLWISIDDFFSWYFFHREISIKLKFDNFFAKKFHQTRFIFANILIEISPIYNCPFFF